MNIIQNELRQRVKTFLDEKGISQARFAKELAVPKGYIAQVLKGKFNYSLSKLIALSLAVGAVPRFELKTLNEYLLQEEKKRAMRQIHLSRNNFLEIKDSKNKVSLRQNENGSIASLDVNQASIITPGDTKIA